MKTVHIVPHMHWDREWYFSTEESRILLVNNMAEIMDMLENNPDYPYYVLDGQTAILEDYFAVCPEQKERVEKLVKAGKLIVGPWYTQTDELVIGGESITRNLLYGLKDSQALGASMKIGYLPDSFGQSGQMPQILNQFGIQRAMFWRGTSERHGTDKTEFYWEGNDGSKVLTQLLPLGYAIGKYLPQDKVKLKERMDKYLPVLDHGATNDEGILPNGHDQMPIQKDIFEVINQLEELYPEKKFFLSRYENVFDILETKDNLPTIKGEFFDGKYSRVHRSIFSTRMDIKAANVRIENKLTNILEPLASLAYSLGHTYHHGLIEGIWKEIMKNHAHDSIGCCCSDKVHFEIMARFINAEERTDRLIEFYQRKIVEGIPSEKGLDKLVLFNLLPCEREQVVETSLISKYAAFKLVDSKGVEVAYEIIQEEIIDPGLIDRQIVHYGNYDPFIKYSLRIFRNLPAMGYEVLYVEETAEKKLPAETIATSIENGSFKIIGNANGTITLTDKRNQFVYPEIFSLEDVADDGDEYDFSPLENDHVRLSKDEITAVVSHQQAKNSGKLTLQFTWQLPQDLAARKAKQNNGAVAVTIELAIASGKSAIDLHVSIDNHCQDHRIRLLIPSEIASIFSYADNQFGLVKRAVTDEALAVWAKEEWDERPDAIYPFLSHVSLTNASRTVSVFTNSSREYEVVGSDYSTLAITLFRSVGVLGKENLLRRPGRPSGIKMATPDSQLLKTIELDLAVQFTANNYAESAVAKGAKEYLTPFVTYNQIPYNAMKLNPSGIASPKSYSLFTQENPALVMSTVKKAETENRLLGRFYNPTEENQTLAVQGIETPEFYTLNEKTVVGTTTIAPNAVVTIALP